MKRKLYLAYGSNMSVDQMNFRCPDARIVGKAAIKNYRLMYKGSRTGAYATIEPAKGYEVPVVVWEISERDERRLDIYEGFPNFYYKQNKMVEIKPLDGGEPLGIRKAMVYIMDERRAHGIPHYSYENILIEGYERFGFNKEILKEARIYTEQQLLYRKKSFL